MKKLRNLITKQSKTKINMIYKGKMLTFSHYHQEMLVNMNFQLVRSSTWEKYVRKADTIKRFEYSPLGNKLKNQADIAKDQYKLFKDQTIAIINNREDENMKLRRRKC